MRTCGLAAEYSEHMQANAAAVCMLDTCYTTEILKWLLHQKDHKEQKGLLTGSIRVKHGGKLVQNNFKITFANSK